MQLLITSCSSTATDEEFKKMSISTAASQGEALSCQHLMPGQIAKHSDNHRRTTTTQIFYVIFLV